MAEQKPYKVATIFGNDIKISCNELNNPIEKLLRIFSLKSVRPIVGCRGV